MNLLLTFDLLGVFFFALSGCLLAASKRFDILGSLLLGALTGLGGGITRDVIISAGVPTSFEQPVYLVPPLLATIVVRMGLLTPGRFRKALLLFDAGGLALFCVSGTLVGIAAGLNPVGSVLMGVTTAAGGGLLRDVVANEVPAIIRRDGGLYVVPAAVGSILVALIHAWGLNPDARVGLGEIVVAGLVFGFRGLSLQRRWKLPAAGPSSSSR